MLPAYQAIIGMGRTALPFIFEELHQRGGHWFWALRAITGENPVPPEHRGNVEAMTQDWLRWARDRGGICPELNPEPAATADRTHPPSPLPAG